MSLILPPRIENRVADEAVRLFEMPIEIPIYEAEDSDSMRPTWLPVDPSTFVPPPRRSRGAELASAGKIALLLVAIWGLAFASVVAPHFAREYVAKRSAAAGAPIVSNVVAPNALPISPVSPSNASVAPTPSVDAAVTLTVDVMSLPVSKDVPPARNRKPRSRS